MSENGSYWASLARSRMSRRGLLQAGAALGAGVAALSLIGCGGGTSNTNDSSGKGSNLLSKPVDSDAKAVRGTTLPLQINNDFAAWNIEGNGDAATQANHVYSRVVKFKAIKYPEPRSAVTEGDAASAWEISPDGLTYTFKIRPNQKFDPRPPTNNRVLTAADLKFSWDRYAQISPYGPDLAAAADKTAPVLSVEAPDASTAVMKLAYPFAGLLPELSFTRHLVVLPVEADDKFNTKLEQRGSGMWRLKEYQRSASVSYVTNPDYYDAAKVLPGEVEYPILQEYSSRLAQFRAGRIATMAFQPEDVLQTKKDLPQLLMMSDGVFSQGGQSIRFGFLPDSPFRDARLRQAISMLIDRDLFIETFRNTREFENAGLDVPRRWHTSIPCGYDDFWLNPQDQKAFGENYKYYQLNPAEAKKLVRAVNPNGIETDFIWTNNQYGPAFANMAQVLQQMWQATGDFKLRTKNPDYQTDWRPNYDRSFGKYSGVSLGSAGSGTPDVNGQITARLHVGDNERTGHLDDSGKIDQRLEDLISGQRKELDVKKRASIIYEMQQYVAKQAYYIMDAGDAPSYTLAWPWVGNWGVYRNWTGGVDATEVYPHLWIDEALRKKG